MKKISYNLFIFRRLILAFIFISSFVMIHAQTEIEVHIDNTISPNSPSPSYVITVILHLSTATPTSGSLIFTVPGNTNHTETLVFDDADICVDRVKCKYADQYGKCQEAIIDVNCFCDNPNYSSDAVAPYIENVTPNTCHEFEYYQCDDYYGEFLDYYFRITD